MRVWISEKQGIAQFPSIIAQEKQILKTTLRSCYDNI